MPDGLNDVHMQVSDSESKFIFITTAHPGFCLWGGGEEGSTQDFVLWGLKENFTVTNQLGLVCICTYICGDPLGGGRGLKPPEPPPPPLGAPVFHNFTVQQCLQV